jgi:ribonuclease P protein component
MPVLTDHARPEPGGACLPTSERLPRSSRLLRRGDFLRVQTGGKRVHTAHFIILLSPGVGSRLGVTVGRRVGCAVRRNRIKRVVREVFRRNRELFPSDCDVVLVARAGAERLDYGSVKDEISRAQAALARLLARLSSPSKPSIGP